MDKNYAYVVQVFGNRPEPQNKSGRQGYRINIGVASSIEAAKKIGEDYFNNDPEIKALLGQDDKLERELENVYIEPRVIYEKCYAASRDKVKTPEHWYMSYEVQQFELQ